MSVLCKRKTSFSLGVLFVTCRVIEGSVQGIFTERHFANRYFADRTFCRQMFCRKAFRRNTFRRQRLFRYRLTTVSHLVGLHREIYCVMQNCTLYYSSVYIFVPKHIFFILTVFFFILILGRYLGRLETLGLVILTSRYYFACLHCTVIQEG